MPDDEARRRSPAVSPTVPYSYAIVRVVPRVEREEFINAGAILFAPTRRFLEARIELDAERLHALAPSLDRALVERHLRTYQAIAAGAIEGGPLAVLPQSDRFHWLTAPRSTVIQASPVHTGRCADPDAALEELLEIFVRRSPN
jgi:hypothetical protein